MAADVLGILRALVTSRDLGAVSGAERSRERYRRVAATTVASIGAQGVASVVSVAMVPLAVNYLGAGRYGVWMSLTSLIAIVTAADLGIGNGLLNAVAEADGRQDRRTASELVASALCLLTAVAILLAVVVGLLDPHVSWSTFVNVHEPALIDDVRPTALVLLACSFLAIPLSTAVRVRMGFQEGFVNGLWQAAGSLLGLAGLFVAIALRANMAWLVLAYALGPVLANAGNLLFLIAGRRWLTPHWRAVHRSAVWLLLRRGLLFAILQGVVAAAFLSDNLIVAWIFGPEAVAQYAVHAQLFAFVPLLAAMVLSPFWPAYTEAIARHDIHWVRLALLRSITGTIALVGLGSIAVLALGTWLINAWVGSHIAASEPLMRALVVWAILSSVGNAVAMFLNGAGVLKLQVVLAVCMGVAAVAGKYIGAQMFGLPGVVWGTTLAYALCSAVPTAIALPRILGALQRRAT